MVTTRADETRLIPTAPRIDNARFGACLAGAVCWHFDHHAASLSQRVGQQHTEHAQPCSRMTRFRAAFRRTLRAGSVAEADIFRTFSASTPTVPWLLAMVVVRSCGKFLLARASPRPWLGIFGQGQENDTPAEPEYIDRTRRSPPPRRMYAPDICKQTLTVNRIKREALPLALSGIFEHGNFQLATRQSVSKLRSCRGRR
jgi:hypothetical protein